jgi:hypothetical protein
VVRAEALATHRYRLAREAVASRGLAPFAHAGSVARLACARARARHPLAAARRALPGQRSRPSQTIPLTWQRTPARRSVITTSVGKSLKMPRTGLSLAARQCRLGVK